MLGPIQQGGHEEASMHTQIIGPLDGLDMYAGTGVRVDVRESVDALTRDDVEEVLAP